MIRDLTDEPRPAGMDPSRLGRAPFLLRKGAYFVIDGDTIRVRANTENAKSRHRSGIRPRIQGRAFAFAIRFRSIAAPELPKHNGTDHILARSGIDPHGGSPGMRAKDGLRRMVRDMALLVVPSGRLDRYGRLLADMSRVPSLKGGLDLAQAVSIEHLLVDAGLVSRFGQERLPTRRPEPAAGPRGTTPYAASP